MMSEPASKPKYNLNDLRRQIEGLRQSGLNKDLYLKLHRVLPSTLYPIEPITFEMSDFEEEIRLVQGIIDSMTADERENPRMIDSLRCRRIARGAGVSPSEVRSLVKQFGAVAAAVEQIDWKSLPIPPATKPSPVAHAWPSTLDRLALFPNWNRNLMLWEFVADR
jgi:signal recognition particle subunit SRP54